VVDLVGLRCTVVLYLGSLPLVMYLREGVLDDIPYVADIGCEALWDDEIVQYLAPNRARHPLCHRDNYLYRTRKRFFAGDRLIVAVTDNEDDAWKGKESIVGFAFWSDTMSTSKPRSLPASILGNGENLLQRKRQKIDRFRF